MTLIVNHDGVVHQKDLESDTASVGAKIKTFNPADTWRPI
jgi:hypothetical protein